jgi:hypothetical protein
MAAAPSPGSFTITLNGPTLSGSRNLSVTKAFTGNREDGLIATIAAGVTSQQFLIVFPYATIQLLYMLAKGGNLTVKTNAADATGGNTINLVDSRPTLFEVNGPFPNPLTANVTSVFVTNAGAVPVQIDIYALNQE